MDQIEHFPHLSLCVLMPPSPWPPFSGFPDAGPCTLTVLWPPLRSSQDAGCATGKPGDFRSNLSLPHNQLGKRGHVFHPLWACLLVGTGVGGDDNVYLTRLWEFDSMINTKVLTWRREVTSQSEGQAVTDVRKPEGAPMSLLFLCGGLLFSFISLCAAIPHDSPYPPGRKWLPHALHVLIPGPGAV